MYRVYIYLSQTIEKEGKSKASIQNFVFTKIEVFFYPFQFCQFFRHVFLLHVIKTIALKMY